MKICLVGNGAFGKKHLQAISQIEDAEVVCVVGAREASTKKTAEEFGVKEWTTSLEEALKKDFEAVIIASPTQIHASQAIACMRAGKHVMIEIPMADTLRDAQAIVDVQKETGLVAMAGHTRRFNPSHQWIHNKIKAGELNIQQMDVQTYFFRRTNTNALGEARSWTDHLLWHHACHTVDLFAYQTGEEIVQVQAMQGPIHPELGIALDMSIGLKSASGAICTLSLSFNNDGPFGTFFRYICDNGTYLARYDDLYDGRENQIDVSKVAVSMNGIELQDREFIAAIKEKREPNASVAQALSAMKILDALENKLAQGVS
ncbi:Gfo/Idh/MocA family oxidoreductase [Sulfurospirillum sp. 1612]|uniref:Gfo/Idh/MocA family oxidoreductase n=1 Tax=Sulfurospirillum sp. 1612 TaxID=3094835 RepID=UPI002F95B4D8